MDHQIRNIGRIAYFAKGRVFQAYPERQRLNELVGNLFQLISSLKIQFRITTLHISDQDVRNSQNAQLNHLVQHTGEVGRPRPCVNALEERQLRFFQDSLGLRWADTAQCLGVSERTLRRRRYELGLLLMQGNYANLSDEHLDDHVRDVLQATPRIGLTLVRGALRSRGLNVQWERIRRSINRVNPLACTVCQIQFITWQTYNVRSPNSLW